MFRNVRHIVEQGTECATSPQSPRMYDFITPSLIKDATSHDIRFHCLSLRMNLDCIRFFVFRGYLKKSVAGNIFNFVGHNDRGKKCSHVSVKAL
jgi:hypothetical protein